MNILLGVTGSVAATLTPKVLKALGELGEVRVVYTESGWFLSDYGAGIKGLPSQYLDASEYPVGGWRKGDPVLHVDLRAWADMMVIAPCTANTLAKIATGQSDNLLTNIVRAWQIGKPLFVAPAMNTSMWTNPFTKRHLDTLWEVYRAQVIEPQSKVLACGDEGVGAMADIGKICQIVRAEKLHQEYLNK